MVGAGGKGSSSAIAATGMNNDWHNTAATTHRRHA
jgi:hypothetical protein